MATFDENIAKLTEQLNAITATVSTLCGRDVTLAEVPTAIGEVVEMAADTFGRCYYTAICFSRNGIQPETPVGGSWTYNAEDKQYQFIPPVGWSLSVAPAEDTEDQFTPIWMSTAIFDSKSEKKVQD